MKSITDEAEVSIDFPDKSYVGLFGHGAGFDVNSDAKGVVIRLSRNGGERRTVEVHLHYYLFADILAELSESIGAVPLDDAHRSTLLEAARKLEGALRPASPGAESAKSKPGKPRGARKNT